MSVTKLPANPSIQGTPEKLRFSVPSLCSVAPDLERAPGMARYFIGESYGQVYKEVQSEIAGR
ncbi:MAG TPA: hypothetical protein VMV40_01825 [Acidiferrobacter sp.]|nr:hypothetical protein [Acidiferrobacter sp.]